MPSATRPNVLFIIADDHRHHAIRALGDPVVRTPLMDALVARGASFTTTRHMGSLSPAVCMPARASLHTGRNVFHNCVDPDINNWQGQMTLPSDVTLMGEAFRHAGYQTFATGKWHNDKAAFNRSFETGSRIFLGGMHDHLTTPTFEYDPAGEYPDDAKQTTGVFSTEMFANAAIDFLDAREDDRPFFAYVAFTSPHDPRMAPKPWAELYAPDEMPLPPNYLPEHPFDEGDHLIRDEKLARFPRTPEEIRRHIADYYAMITHQDHHMQRILDALEEQDQLDNTLIVYTADHGLAVGQHGLLGKQNMYEHSVRVPLLVSGPGVPADTKIPTLSQTPDIYPTLCELADIDIPQSVQAHSLVPLFEDATAAPRPHAVSLYKHHQRMITDNQYKYIRYTRDPAAETGSNREQLFKIDTDPWELDNLANDRNYETIKRTLTSKLRDWQKGNDDPLVGR